jgi:glycerol uptake facilitator-like aquaporin
MRMAEPGAWRTCFFEDDPNCSLLRRAGVEGIGTYLLMLAATASGLQAQHLFSALPGLALAMSAVTIAGVLVGLIIAFGSVSGGHFNPLITALQWLGGERPSACTAAYILAQAAGAVAGALTARILFGGGPETGHAMNTGGMAVSEAVASAGLMAVVFGCIRSARADTGPFAVGAWLTGAILAFPSTSYANPAVTLGALFASGPIALDRPTTLLFIGMEVVGALIAFGVISLAFRPRSSNPAKAAFRSEP